ncbi:MAG: hypothetical protein WBN04_09190 [Paracoccaceae bacterium]
MGEQPSEKSESGVLQALGYLVGLQLTVDFVGVKFEVLIKLTQLFITPRQKPTQAIAQPIFSVLEDFRQPSGL